jgi:PAS domain S-box-containing protein
VVATEAPVDAAGGTRGDDVLDALAAVVRVLEESQEGVAVARARARQLREGRTKGATYAELLTSADGPLVLEVVTELLEGLFAAGSRLRRAEARALYAEGLSMEKVSRLLRVSRQRVSALIRATAGEAKSTIGRLPRRSAGLALTGPEYRMIADALPHIVWVATPRGEVEYLNRMGTQYTGLPAEASSGRQWATRVHPDDRDRAVEAWRDATEREAPYELEYRLFRFDGQARWHDCRSLPIRGPDGQVTKWIGTATDIDDQRRREEQLRHAERAAAEALAVVEALYDGAPVALGMLDRDLRVVRMNARLAALNGAPMEQQVGRSLVELHPGLGRGVEEVRSVFDRAEPVLNLPVGEPGQHLASCYPVRVDGDLVGIGLVVLELSGTVR